MMIRKLAATTLLFVFSTTALAVCPYPMPLDNLPDGKSATNEEMMSAQADVKTYVADVEAYLQCLTEELAALGEIATLEQRLIREKRHNAAVEVMNSVADTYNVAVREYKARQEDESGS